MHFLISLIAIPLTVISSVTLKDFRKLSTSEVRFDSSAEKLGEAWKPLDVSAESSSSRHVWVFPLANGKKNKVQDKSEKVTSTIRMQDDILLVRIETKMQQAYSTMTRAN